MGTDYSLTSYHMVADNDFELGTVTFCNKSRKIPAGVTTVLPSCCALHLVSLSDET